jgi:hypothetical protein
MVNGGMDGMQAVAQVVDGVVIDYNNRNIQFFAQPVHKK